MAVYAPEFKLKMGSVPFLFALQAHLNFIKYLCRRYGGGMEIVMKVVRALILIVLFLLIIVGCDSKPKNDGLIRDDEGGLGGKIKEGLENELAESIASSFIAAIDDILAEENTLIALDAMKTLIEQAQSAGFSENDPDLYKLMINANICATDGNFPALKQTRDFIVAYFGTEFDDIMEEQSIRSQALELLLDWKMNDYNDFEVLIAFGALNDTAKETIGAENDLSRIIDKAYTFGMCLDSENSTVVDMAINILAYDYSESETNFLNENSYLFYDCRYEYETAYPVYDLSTGLYGVYDIKTNQYICEPILTYLSEPDEEGYMCACYKGYYGCINMIGERAIGFMYDEPLHFEKGLSIISTNKRSGVIDSFGKIVLQPKYKAVYLKPDNQIIVADLYESNDTDYAIFDYEGNALTGHWYDSIKFQDERIYAHWNSTQQKEANGESDEIYDLFDYYGNRLVGEGTELADIWGVKLPDSYGIMIAECHGNVTNSYGITYPHWGTFDTYYSFVYLTSDLQRLNNNYYRCTYSGDLLTNFNKKGYAIATIGTSQRGTNSVKVLLYKDGKELEILPVINSDTVAVDANDYVFKMQDQYIYSGQPEQYGIYIRSTKEYIAYRKVELIDGTNMAIVQVSDTLLYGLYDGEQLVLPPQYNKIVFEDNHIVATQGAEKITYQPKY